MADSDSSWEENSITSEAFATTFDSSDSSENDSHDNSGSEGELEGSGAESDREFVDVDGAAVGPALVVRGVEPYRFEPVAPAPADDEPRDAAPMPRNENMDSLLNTEWCSCGKCEVMAIENCKCCREIDQLTANELELDEPPNCFTDHPWFEATCLNPGTLQTAYYAYRQQYGARAVEGDRASKFRHVSYRQVVRWCWGFLGRHNRVPLPACVMLAVRRAYPDAHGVYKGFQFPPLEDL